MSLRGRHSRAVLAPTVRFLLVTLGGSHFALHADRVQGLLTTDEAGSAGVLTVQGVIYSRINLAARLGLPDAVTTPEARIVLLSKGQAAGHLLVDLVHGLKELESSQVLPLPGQFQGEERRWYQGLILFSDTVAVILNPLWVLEGTEPVGAIPSANGEQVWKTVGPGMIEGQV